MGAIEPFSSLFTRLSLRLNGSADTEPYLSLLREFLRGNQDTEKEIYGKSEPPDIYC